MRGTHQSSAVQSGGPFEAPFPDGTGIVHVGPHKTGTTVVQGSLHAARERLAAHGVRLPSPERNPVAAVSQAVEPRPKDPSRPAWRELAAAFAATEGRLSVLSSEFFADADDAAARRVVGDLGERAHVLITLRPLGKIMPSQWQQHVQSGMSTPYEQWLAELLDPDSEDEAAKRFWNRHRHDRFTARWASAAGAERVSVLIVDDSRPEKLLHDFEALLGLPEGTLRKEKNTTNRSLTAGETEAIRLIAAAFEARGWPKQRFREFVRYGAVPRIKTGRTPPPGEARIATPSWALDRAAEIGADIAESIAASGVRVIGDLGLLRGEEIEPAEPGPAQVDPEVTVQAVLGCVNAALKHQDEPRPAPEREPSLLRVVGQRTRNRLFGSRGGA